MIYFAGIFDDLLGVITWALRYLFYFICVPLYQIVIYLYDVFDLLCNSRLLKIEIIDMLSKRIGLILGIVMLFLVIFSFINSLINPDNFSDKKKSPINIVKKVLIVIVMFGISNFAFNAFYYVQSTVVKSKVITKILVPAKPNVSDFGNLLASRLFTSFYTMDEEVLAALEDSPNSQAQAVIDNCSKVVDLLNTRIYYDGKFDAGYECLTTTVSVNVDEAGNKDIFVIDFNFVLSLATACFLIYFLFSYCISIGTRAVQIAFLEIISPVAFVGYLSPKDDNMLSKWWKVYFSTYIDLFLRIMIINLVVFLISIFLDNDGNSYSAFWESVTPEGGLGAGTKVFVTVIMIFGLLTFAKKAPELLKNLFPSGASGLGLGASLKNAVGFGALMGGIAGLGVGVAGRLPGAIGNTITGFKNGGLKGGAKALFSGAGGLVTGGLGGSFRGLKSGNSKGGFGALAAGQQAQAKVNLARAQRIASGKGLGETFMDSTYGFLGMQSGYEKYNQDLSMSNAIKETLSNEDPVKHIREVRQSYLQKCATEGVVADGQTLVKFDDYEKDAMRQMYAYSHDHFDGEQTIIIKDDELGLNIEETYKSNQGIYEQIKSNEKRSGKSLITYDDWKTDNNEIKNKIAKKTKGSK